MAPSEGMRGVKVPEELHTVPHNKLEGYVRARMMQFSQALAVRIAPTANQQMVQQAAFDAFQTLPPPDYSGAALASRDLQLVFRHDCQNLGCLDHQCVLCEHNPQRRCSVNFSNKYLVNDTLRAKCDAPIRVEIIDRATGQPVTDDLPASLSIELCVLDGNQYDSRCAENGGEEGPGDVDACALLLNNKASALLVPGPGGALNNDNMVVVPLVKGVAVLPDLHVSDSSEALLSGRKPPFRLLARVSASDGVSIRTAVSEGFVVATRRTRTAGKVDIPNVDDHVGKLEHMGRETVKKLQDIRGSALAVGVDVHVPDNCINKVGEFRKLALLAEADGHLRQKLQQVLKLSKEKWDEARDHAMRAVVADNRMRIWYADNGSMEVGLLFTCRLGTVDLDRPVGLLTKKASDGAQTTMEATLMAQQTPQQREQVRSLQPQATTSWWQHGHPGWAIYPVDSDQFLATGALDPTRLPANEQPMALPGQMTPGMPGSPSSGGGYAFNPAAFASAFAMAPAGVPNEMLLRAMGAGSYLGPPFIPGALPSGGPLNLGQPGMQQQQQGGSPMGDAAATTTSPFADVQPSRQQAIPGGGPHHEGGQHHHRDPTMHHQGQQQQGHQGHAYPSSSPQGSPPITSAFAAPRMAPSLENMPSLNLGNLQAMLGADFKLPFSMQGFPSLPNAGHLPGSGDLEQLLAMHGGESMLPGGAGRFPSMALGKFGSMEPPSNGGAKGENGQTGGRGSAQGNNPAPHQQGSGGPAAVATRSMQRRHSGLESMQSIEHALHAVRRPDSVHDAIDAAVREVTRNGHGTGLAGSKRK